MSGFIDKKYINLVSAQLEKFAWKKDNLANCRCPICGDSQKNKTKARGYFYQKGNDYFYKCHNCGAGHSLYRFLESVSPTLTKEYSFERWKNGENGKSNYVKPKETELLSIFKKPEFKPTHDLLKPLTSVKDLPDNHVCKQFVEMRRIPKKFYDILYYTEDFGSYMKLVDPEVSTMISHPRLIIPFFNKKDEVVAVQGRSLSMKDEYKARTTARYVTVKSDKSIERLWYGMWRANPKKRVYVVEGPLDSLFVDNTVAMVGAASLEHEPARFANSDMVYVLDNEPRNPQIVKFNENLIEQGKTVCIWPNGIKDKDINDMIYHMKPKQIKKIMDDNAVSGLEAKMRLNRWRKV
jgi:hypothetical protein